MENEANEGSDHATLLLGLYPPIATPADITMDVFVQGNSAVVMEEQQ